MYSELQADRIIDTIDVLIARITERFPGSSLRNVGAELRVVAESTKSVVTELRNPHWPLRIAAGGGILALLAVVVLVAALTIQPRDDSVTKTTLSLLQGIESALNDVILISLAIYFLISLEGRVKRRIALRSLHRLRSIVHIVDMHQLTKDPEHLLTPDQQTASSPQRSFTRFELARYLDYSSELLSLASKLAALHAQYVDDTVVLDAVNDIETLAGNLSSKIWQKIMILDVTLPHDGRSLTV